METTNKQRKQSKYKEYERQRRNKFNDAILRLGEIVKAINKENVTANGKESSTAQYAKVEIVENAIVCLQNCDKEKSLLKTELLALQVKLDNRNSNTKDACTQIQIINKRAQKNKYVKVMLAKKPKRKVLIEKSVTPNVSTTVEKVPKLLPKTNFIKKKGPENTIVVLPAAPYIFPHRPFLFPTAPPAIILVDHNAQLNKPPQPVNRINDITKTTMVNILPITAYSGPLSATKSKKCNVRAKSVTKKPKNKPKPSKGAKEDVCNEKSKNIVVSENMTVTTSQESKKEGPQSDSTKNDKTLNVPNSNNSRDKDDNTKIIKSTEVPPSNNSNSVSELNETAGTVKITDVDESKVKDIPTNPNKVINQNGNVNDNKVTKTVPEKEADDKDKENKLPKLPNILDSTLCDNVVDGGNARLELAEELLAASPTAAFLMSFPLVSGNRADSPAEEPHVVQPPTKERRNEIPQQVIPYFEKPNVDSKTKPPNKEHASTTKTEPQKYAQSHQIKQPEKNANAISVTCNENPFLNLSMPSLITTSCTLADPTFGLDFDCNNSKTISNQPTNYASSNNIFYKSDPYSSVKSTIYSTSSISSGHEFNSLGLYPCAMEKYTPKNKSDYATVEDNLMKIGSSRLTYDIDLGWSQKSFDFVNCTTSSSTLTKDNVLNTFNKDTMLNTFTKDNTLTSVSAPYSTSYNPFNPEFHVPFPTPNPSKKDSVQNKPNPTFTDPITSFYSQPTSIWTEDPFYANNVSKSLSNKHQSYPALEQSHLNVNLKQTKQFETKQTTAVESTTKANLILSQQIADKYTKKSPHKTHINWMTSEIRPQNNCVPTHSEIKNVHKSYNQHNPSLKKQDQDTNYFPINMHNFPAQPVQEEFQVWPSTRTLGPTEISIEPPPINLPTLVGDLALGPHDKKKGTDMSIRAVPQADLQNSNFLSVTQLMNRSNDNMHSRYPTVDTHKSVSTKHSINNDTSRKSMTSLPDSNIPQPCYVFNDSKPVSSYENMSQFIQSKSKSNKSDKNAKVHKNSYSAEALLRGGTCTQKTQDYNTPKFIAPSQKYNEFSAPQDSSVAHVSHFPPLLDYADNSYSGQQFSGTTLYNSTTNTISNTFYSNFMPGSTNLMSSNYATGPFPGDYIEYNQAECNYNPKYEELKMRGNPSFPQEKLPSTYKSSRGAPGKHKLECSKKESSKKYQSKRSKMSVETEDWSDSHLLWQNKPAGKKHTGLPEELTFQNYVGNQIPSQYQPELFNAHLMPANMPGHNVDRSLATFPVTSRANFNLSTIFPEITMKVQ